jgi:ferric-dicitrate binding protein FerR (iron transport regulator)
MSVPCEEIRPELEALLGALTEGRLETEGKQRLAAILREHPDARQFYLDYCQMHALLQSAHGVLQALQVPSAARSRRLAWSAAAAALLLLVGGALLLRGMSRIDASIASVQGSAWVLRGGQRAVLSGSRDLRDGDRLVTDAEARTEVRTQDGSRILLLERSEVQLRNVDGRGRFELKDGAIRCDIAHQPAGRSLVFSTPQAEAAILGTSFELAVEGHETRLHTLSGRVLFSSGGQSVEVGPGERAAADGTGISRWTPVCDLDFSKKKELPPQMETVFCASRLLHTPGRKVEPAPERTHFGNGGLVLGAAPGVKVEHGLVVTRWKEEVGDDVALEAEVAGGERWSLGFSLSGDSFEGYRIIFAVLGYPEGIAIDTIHPVDCVVLAADPRPITYEKDHLLRVEKQGKRIRVWVDRQLRIDTEITHALPDGRRRSFALSNFGAPPTIRTLRVWKAAAR